MKKNLFLALAILLAMAVNNIYAQNPTRGKLGNHEWVDLGLPSGTKWATCNVGASKPEEYGDYFAWGEVEPKEVYDWSTYKWCNSPCSFILFSNFLLSLHLAICTAFPWKCIYI